MLWTLPPNTLTKMCEIYRERIEALRAMMLSHGWDAVIIGGSDPHQSEYPAERWKQVRFLTGFTGEAGDVVVTLDHAGLWTDTRYFIQAVQQLEGTGVVLHKMRVPEQVPIDEWLAIQFDASAVIAVDSLCQSVAAVENLEKRFNVARVADILSPLWTDRPPIPQTPIFTIRAGESRLEKIAWLRSEMSERGCDAFFASALDDIAWLLNVRASDIDYNPLVISYLLVGQDYVKWYVLKGEIEDSETELAFNRLQEDGVEILPYQDAAAELSEFDGARLWIDEDSLNDELYSAITRPAVREANPIPLRKSVKNPEEIEWLKEAMIDDGVAMEKFLYWLEKSVLAGKRITEWDASVKLSQYRGEIDDFQSESFETISAYGAGGALPHYITPNTDAPVIEAHGLYLCDSGGQYLRGTTDITRTVPMGDCTDEERRDYTLVLKGHIDLAMMKFPAGTPGCRIDAAARAPLWAHGMNFGHGTGHGVGFFLGVHEGPQDIRQNLNGTPLLEGMVCSNEPGIYRESKHGVRHENLVLCVDAGTTEFGSFLAFETITLCHIDTSALDLELLSKEEIKWLNDYNEKVRHNLCSLLDDDVASWLEAKTRPVGLE